MDEAQLYNLHTSASSGARKADEHAHRLEHIMKLIVLEMRGEATPSQKSKLTKWLNETLDEEG